jgi:hypothetical protein
MSVMSGRASDVTGLEKGSDIKTRTERGLTIGLP